MSDYSVTHADYDKHHQEQDWQAWIDSLAPEEPIAVPTCGMCVHFVPQQRFNAPSDGRELIAASYCKLRASADLPCLYQSIADASNCPFYEFDCDF